MGKSPANAPTDHRGAFQLAPSAYKLLPHWEAQLAMAYPLIRHMIKGWRDTRDLCVEQLKLIQSGKARFWKRRRHDERGHGLAAKGQSGNGSP